MTMPSEEAKKAKTMEMKCRSDGVSFWFVIGGWVGGWVSTGT